LDDLVELPMPVPITVKAPVDIFENVAALCEWIHVYGNIIDLKRQIPHPVRAGLGSQASAVFFRLVLTCLTY
jgi:hypothetical protein